MFPIKMREYISCCSVVAFSLNTRKSPKRTHIGLQLHLRKTRKTIISTGVVR